MTLLACGGSTQPAATPEPTVASIDASIDVPPADTPEARRQPKKRKVITLNEIVIENADGGVAAVADAGTKKVIQLSEITIQDEVPDLEKTLAAFRPSAFACYKDVIQMEKRFSVNIRLAARIEPDGSVSSVSVVETSKPNATFEQCLMGTLKRMAFGHPSSASDIEVPLSFR